MLQIESNKQLAAYCSRLNYCGENYNYMARLVTIGSCSIFQVTELTNMVNNLFFSFFFNSKHLHKINVKTYNYQVRINYHT